MGNYYDGMRNSINLLWPITHGKINTTMRDTINLSQAIIHGKNWYRNEELDKVIMAYHAIPIATKADKARRNMINLSWVTSHQKNATPKTPKMGNTRPEKFICISKYSHHLFPVHWVILSFSIVTNDMWLRGLHQNRKYKGNHRQSFERHLLL